MENVEVYEQLPNKFSSGIETTACYLEIDQKLLLLQRSSKKSEAGKWGVPAGKVENGETAQDAAIRELFEETGVRIEHSQIRFLGTIFIRKPTLEYVYHMFQVQIGNRPNIILNDENDDYIWASSEEVCELPLMAGAQEALKSYRKHL